MPSRPDPCILSLPEIADAQFRRVRLREDELGRLSAVLQGPVPDFARLHLDVALHRAGDASRGGPGLLEPGALPPDHGTHQQVASAAREALAGLTVPR